LSSIRRWLESLKYVPGYYRLFFVYVAVIVLVFVYVVVLRGDALLFATSAVTVVYAGLVIPIFVQMVVGKLSKRIGWWVATITALAGLYAVLRVLVAAELLSPGFIYRANIYGIIWTAAIVVAAMVNIVVHHGLSGLVTNVKRDLGEIRVGRRLTKGEPFIQDKRTVVVLVLAIIFTFSIFVLRQYLIKRPDLISQYVIPEDVADDLPRVLKMELSNEVGQPVELVTVSVTGYIRYPAFTNKTGSDMLSLAKSIDIISSAYERAQGAPADTIDVKTTSRNAGNIKEISIDLSRAFEALGLYVNQTSHLLIPSRFIVQWDKKDKRMGAVWAGTPGIPFMRWGNGNRTDGRGSVDMPDPYQDLVFGGRIELKDVAPGETYGFALSGVYHNWLGEVFAEIDLFLLSTQVQVKDGRARTVVAREIKKAT
jgi:hypothetical protein